MNCPIANEEFYDQEIAPALLKLAEKCKERDMAFLASVEFDPKNHGIGRTEFRPPDSADLLSAAQRLTHWAAHAKGNIDLLILWCIRHGDEHGHGSVYLRQLGCKNVNYAGNEAVAMAVTSSRD